MVGLARKTETRAEEPGFGGSEWRRWRGMGSDASAGRDRRTRSLDGLFLGSLGQE